MTEPANASSSGGDARPTGDTQQLANQAKQLANDAQAIKGQLQQGGVQAKDLKPVDDVIKALRDMTNEKNLQNPEGSAGALCNRGREVQDARVRDPQARGHDQRAAVPVGLR